MDLSVAALLIVVVIGLFVVLRHYYPRKIEIILELSSILIDSHIAIMLNLPGYNRHLTLYKICVIIIHIYMHIYTQFN